MMSYDSQFMKQAQDEEPALEFETHDMIVDKHPDDEEK